MLLQNQVLKAFRNLGKMQKVSYPYRIGHVAFHSETSKSKSYKRPILKITSLGIYNNKVPNGLHFGLLMLKNIQSEVKMFFVTSRKFLVFSLEPVVKNSKNICHVPDVYRHDEDYYSLYYL